MSVFDAHTLIMCYRSNNISMFGMMLLVIEPLCQIFNDLEEWKERYTYVNVLNFQFVLDIR